MIFGSLLHPHNPLTFVASTNFLSCMHTPSSPSPSFRFLSIAHIHFLGRSPTVSTTPFRHTPIDKPLQRLPTTYVHTHLPSPPLCVHALCLSYGPTHV